MSAARVAPPLLASAAALLDELFALVRRVALHGDADERVLQAARAVQQRLAEAQPPFTLQVLPEAVLRDGVPLPLEVEGHRRCQQLVGAMSRWGAGELACEPSAAAETWIAFARAVLDATRSGRTARAPSLEGLLLRPLRRAVEGPRDASATADAFAMRQLGRACELLDGAIATCDRAWPWALGKAVAWRIERCLLASRTALGRALELAPEPLSAAHRALSAAYCAQAALARLPAPLLLQRTAAHALLALGCYGLRGRPGAPLAAAAREALPRLLPQPGEELAVDPHRLRVTALVAQAAQGDRAFAALPISGLITAAYELERRRYPEDVPLRLSRADLHAWLVGALGREVHGGWGRALLAALGPVPPGAHVLADGRLGLVLAPSATGEPLRPRVLVGGKPCVPSQPVTLHSPLGMTPWAR